MRVRARITAFVAAALVLGGMPGVAAGAGAVVSVGDVTVAEPGARSGSVAVEVPVTVGPAAAGVVSVAWRTVEGSAGAADFTATSGTLTIPAGAAGGTISLQVRADKLAEGVESFALEATSATGATLADPSGAITILPPAAGLSLGNVAVTEPDTSTLQVAVPAILGAAAAKTVTFGWLLRSASGNVGEDAPAASGTATIPKGALGTLVRVAVNGDTTVEADESVELVVTSLANTPLADGIGTVTLRNTDVPPPDTLGWMPPADVLAGDTSIVYVESQAGDYIGQGRTYRYTQATSQLAVSSTDNRLSV